MSPSSDIATMAPYELLAQFYDAVMHDVDYHAWADFIDEIIYEHHPHAQQLLELACGTGSTALSLHELGNYHILATDLSEPMLDVARNKKDELYEAVQFQQLDFLNIDLEETFDIVYCLFDSVNYIRDPQRLQDLFEGVASVLKPDGYFIFDFTTPRNSRQAIRMLNNEEGHQGPFHFHRTSTYDPQEKLHVNAFDILVRDQQSHKVIRQFHEKHKQRIYTLKEMLEAVEQSPLKLVAKYSEFDLVEADHKSLRITMVVECQNTR
ncbi:MAG: class I SAM-dependent DNA methyltransferase [Bacteroidota bacterium]